MILVTGAAGKTGRAVIDALAGRGVKVRALVRLKEQAETVSANWKAEAMMGDMEEMATYRRALEGVRAVYHICPNMHPEEEAIGKMIITAAREAGIGHFVYHSVLHPQAEKMPHHWHKLRVEEQLIESGLPFTILQPAAYMQNILYSRYSILQRGLFQVPYPLDSLLSLVDLLDVAEAAAVVLTEEGHAGAVYELAGPEAVSHQKIAAILTEVVNRPVRGEQQTLHEWRLQARAAGLGQYQTETMTMMFDYYANFGLVGNSNVLSWLLKRKPAFFADFAVREIANH